MSRHFTSVLEREPISLGLSDVTGPLPHVTADLELATITRELPPELPPNLLSEYRREPRSMRPSFRERMANRMRALWEERYPVASVCVASVALGAVMHVSESVEPVVLGGLEEVSALAPQYGTAGPAISDVQYGTAAGMDRKVGSLMGGVSAATEASYVDTDADPVGQRTESAGPQLCIVAEGEEGLCGDRDTIVQVEPGGYMVDAVAPLFDYDQSEAMKLLDRSAENTNGIVVEVVGQNGEIFYAVANNPAAGVDYTDDALQVLRAMGDKIAYELDLDGFRKEHEGTNLTTGDEIATNIDDSAGEAGGLIDGDQLAAVAVGEIADGSWMSGLADAVSQGNDSEYANNEVTAIQYSSTPERENTIDMPDVSPLAARPKSISFNEWMSEYEDTVGRDGHWIGDGEESNL